MYVRHPKVKLLKQTLKKCVQIRFLWRYVIYSLKHEMLSDIIILMPKVLVSFSLNSLNVTSRCYCSFAVRSKVCSGYPYWDSNSRPTPYRSNALDRSATLCQHKKSFEYCIRISLAVRPYIFKKLE